MGGEVEKLRDFNKHLSTRRVKLALGEINGRGSYKMELGACSILLLVLKEAAFFEGADKHPADLLTDDLFGHATLSEYKRNWGPDPIVRKKLCLRL